MTIFLILWPIICGIAIPLLLNKGINITITHKQEQPKPEEKKKPEYNESLVGLLPKNVQQYYHDNNGQNRF